MKLQLKIYLSQARNSFTEEVHGDSLTLEAFDIFINDLLRMREERHTLSEDEIFRILQATEFAAGRHHKQTRYNKQKTPYIIHPLHVARHLLMTGHIYDADILMAALLHDTVEDTNTSLDELGELFGYKVERLVEEVSDDKNLSKEERKRLQIQNASQKSLEAALIILADKLSNLSDLLVNPPLHWNIERVTDYFLWAQEVIKHLQPANPFLLNALDEVIEKYWKRMAEEEYGK